MDSKNKPPQRMVIDPFDHKPRPFCSSLGKLFAYAFTHNRYLVGTPAEDMIWRAAGELLIEKQLERQREAATRDGTKAPGTELKL